MHAGRYGAFRSKASAVECREKRGRLRILFSSKEIIDVIRGGIEEGRPLTFLRIR
jgi:hypothetical protein